MIDPVMRGFSGSDQPSASAYDACIRCGLCLPSCPTYLETLTETSGPRGRISLVKAVGESRLDLLSPGFVQQMSQCLDCRACEAACPSGVPYGRLLENARAQIRRAQAAENPGASSAARACAYALLERPALMRVAGALLRFAQFTHLISLAGLFGLQREAALAPRPRGAYFSPPRRRRDAEDARGLAALHVGCIMPVAFGDVHRATVRMLLRARLSVVAPQGQGCCGALALHAGDPEIARDLAKRNVAAFEASGADVCVVNAAGCGSTLKEYAALLGDDPDWAARAQRFSSRVRDVTEVLDAGDLPEPTHRVDAVATYQEPCHLVHAQRVSRAPRRLLARIPGLRLVEMNESALCCGSAGTYNLTEPEMAERLRRRKLRAIEETGASIVATANPGCDVNLSAGLREAGSHARVRHVVELLDEAYGGEATEPD